MKLIAYSIDGSILGIDIESWDDTSIDFNAPFQVIQDASTTPDNYSNISSISNWNKFSEGLINDYLVLKTEIKNIEVSLGWNNLSDEDKDLAIKYYAYQDVSINNVVYYLITKGMSQDQAINYLTQEWHLHHKNLLESCKERWYYVKLTIAQYLSFSDAEDLFDTCQNLIFAFTESSRLGKNYADQKDGIMDYIESTNAFLNQGLQYTGYTLAKGTWPEFIQALKNVLIYGIYTKNN